ncbi:hypothetical protein SAMN05216241_106119 [Limimonas halophila]|uniref:DNA methylase n=1 Tax=Limimonas halophila TaxID=1082479 RepID=A0A1G7S4U5_9PROT|nr:hypothetical protein [Limimonas halophila]SDG17982.1 hypothetical protein SAMN05216241_106119 [Limimonas halophila]
MAQSPAHKFGQKIGNLLEDITYPALCEFCQGRDLFVDKKGERPGVRRGQLVKWQDKYGNDHDLDFVIEKKGCARNSGRPIAFVEAAWRRYTKHSRNKAQEIQGALLPIFERYWQEHPFLGAIIAGEFTKESIKQLRSQNFNIVYIRYDDIVKAFGKHGIFINFGEQTPEKDYLEAVRAIENLSEDEWNEIINKVYISAQTEFQDFFERLRKVLDRVIDRVAIIPLHGEEHEFGSPEEAKNFIDSYSETNDQGTFRKYEVRVKYSNGDKIEAEFRDKERVKEFLEYSAI